jgi:malate synthase
VPVAREVFDRLMPGANQLQRLREDVRVGARDLLAVPAGPITERGLRRNVSIGIRYLAAWLAGTGCVPLEHLMEDAATAEISRAQVWQQVRHAARLDDGRTVDAALVERVIEQEMRAIRAAAGERRAGRPELAELARELFLSMSTASELEEFLTLPAYDHLIALERP